MGREPIGNADNVPWDIYIDERKVKGDSALGFLVVPNTASFAHKLFLGRKQPPDGRGRTQESREVHWHNIHRGVMQVAANWIDTVFQHRHAKFFAVPWPRTQTKEYVVLRMLDIFCRRRKLTPPYNVVVIFDYDSAHARWGIQNNIRTTANIARCYHLRSTKVDCLQCCDLFLGATTRLRSDPTLNMAYPELARRVSEGEKLKNSEVKQYLAGYLGNKLATQGRCVYDFRRQEALVGR